MSSLIRHEVTAKITGGHIIVDASCIIQGVRDRISRQVIDTKNTAIREALIKLGWTPPASTKESTVKPQLKVMKIWDEAILPKYATEGAACFDLATQQRGTIYPGDSLTFRTGLAFEIPPGFVMLIFSRSGHGFKNGIRLSNSVGVIDSDYRGEVRVRLHNDSSREYTVEAGERIAQAMLMPAYMFEIAEVSELSETERGDGGYGSTGK